MHVRSRVARRLAVEAVASLSLLLLLASAGRVGAQSVTGMVGKTIGADPEVTNAAEAAEDLLKAAATKGEATRGASGAIATLLTESDNLICSSWILSFRVRYRNMVLEGADANTLRAMQNLMEKVEKACDPIMNPPAQANRAGGGGNRPGPAPGPTPPTPVKVKPIYPNCPECDPLKRALDQATAEHERAQWELAQAIRRTDFLEDVEKSHRTPAEKRAATGGETSKESERFESRKRAAVDNARMRMDAARAKLVDCLEKCNRRVQAQQASAATGTSRGPKLALAGVGAAGVAAIAVSAGGGSDSESTVASATPAPSATTTGTPTTTSSTSGGGPSGVAACSGSYNASFVVSSDSAGHRQHVGMPSNMTLDVTIASVHIRGSAPFVSVDGPIDAAGNFQAVGLGTVAGFDNVTVTMNGTLRDCGQSAGRLQALYSMGTQGELPQGQPITYQVTGTR